MKKHFLLLMVMLVFLAGQCFAQEGWTDHMHQAPANQTGTADFFSDIEGNLNEVVNYENDTDTNTVTETETDTDTDTNVTIKRYGPIVSGECLSHISQNIYGNQSYWMFLAEYNSEEHKEAKEAFPDTYAYYPALTTYPHYIYPGDYLYYPVDPEKDKTEEQPQAEVQNEVVDESVEEKDLEELKPNPEFESIEACQEKLQEVAEKIFEEHKYQQTGYFSSFFTNDMIKEALEKNFISQEDLLGIGVVLTAYEEDTNASYSWIILQDQTPDKFGAPKVVLKQNESGKEGGNGVAFTEEQLNQQTEKETFAEKGRKLGEKFEQTVGNAVKSFFSGVLKVIKTYVEVIKAELKTIFKVAAAPVVGIIGWCKLQPVSTTLEWYGSIIDDWVECKDNIKDIWTSDKKDEEKTEEVTDESTEEYSGGGAGHSF